MRWLPLLIAGVLASAGCTAPARDALARVAQIHGAPAPVVTPVPASAPGPPQPITEPSIEIPALGVTAPLVALGLRRDGSLDVPATADVVGWYSGSPRPGDAGPAVLAGHVDSRSGPGIFIDLHRLGAGSEVLIRDRGRVWRFVVHTVQRHAKDAFPTEWVYGDTPGPELRLITCGGPFDRGSGHYRDNIIVYAALDGWTR